MTTINEEKIQMNRSISDLETFLIKDIHNVPHAFVSTLEVRLKLLNSLKKATFYSRLRRLNTACVKANPQQAKILKEKLKVHANLFYLIPKSEVKRLIKQDESTSIANSCESQAA